MKFSLFCEQTRKLFETVLNPPPEDEQFRRIRSKKRRKMSGSSSTSSSCNYNKSRQSPCFRENRTSDFPRFFSTDSKRRRRASAILCNSSLLRKSWNSLHHQRPLSRSKSSMSRHSFIRNSMLGLSRERDRGVDTAYRQVNSSTPLPLCPQIKFNAQEEPDIVVEKTLSKLTVETSVPDTGVPGEESPNTSYQTDSSGCYSSSPFCPQMKVSPREEADRFIIKSFSKLSVETIVVNLEPPQESPNESTDCELRCSSSSPSSSAYFSSTTASSPATVILRTVGGGGILKDNKRKESGLHEEHHEPGSLDSESSGSSVDSNFSGGVLKETLSSSISIVVTPKKVHFAEPLLTCTLELQDLEAEPRNSSTPPPVLVKARIISSHVSPYLESQKRSCI